jgi:D-aspartate ligase
MADNFRPTGDLIEKVAMQEFNRPPALVANAHITGLGVARALSRHGVPVIALDRSGDGVAPRSDAVSLAGRVSYPLEDPEGFREDIEAIAASTDHAPVAFGCMDEWVQGFASKPAGVRVPFATDQSEDILDKVSLYGFAEDLGVPYPETYRISDSGADTPVSSTERLESRTSEEALNKLGLPLVIKPALKRPFEEAFGTNVVEVGNQSEYDEIVEHADQEGIRIMAQEKVPVATGKDRSLASYIPPEGDPIGLVGNAEIRYPRGFGTSCVVRHVEDPGIRNQALSILQSAGYYGISESEFVYDRTREQYVILDINTRPWKWITLPVVAGFNLPYAAYADAVGASYSPGESTASRWVFLEDYAQLLTGGHEDVLSRSEWVSIVSGEFDKTVAGVYDPADPEPTYSMLQSTFQEREYYCSC